MRNLSCADFRTSVTLKNGWLSDRQHSTDYDGSDNGDLNSKQKSTVIDSGSKSVSVSRYYEWWSEWRKWFPANRIHVVDGDRLVRNPFEEMREVEKFLGVPRHFLRKQFVYNKKRGFFCVISKGGNQTKSPRYQQSSKTQNQTNAIEVKNNQHSTNRDRAANDDNHSINGEEICLGASKGRQHPKVDPDLLKDLRRYFAPYNEQFFTAIGRRFNWDMT